MRKVPSKLEYGMLEAAIAASRSKDPRTQVGAAIFNPDGRVISKGYNGFPQRMHENVMRWESPTKHDYVIHAEVNAIANAARSGAQTLSARMFVTLAPCLQCAKVIAAAGISELVYDGNKTDAWVASKPDRRDIGPALSLLRSSGVKVAPLYGANHAD